jgi:hypothetical protein
MLILLQLSLQLLDFLPQPFPLIVLILVHLFDCRADLRELTEETGGLAIPAGLPSDELDLLFEFLVGFGGGLQGGVLLHEGGEFGVHLDEFLVQVQVLLGALVEFGL